MTALEFLKSTFVKSNLVEERPRVQCNDGFSISIQGGNIYSHCTPQENVNHYESVELGYPSEVEDDIIEYADNKDNLLKTIYLYVPIKTVEQIIEKHGGIKEDM